MTRYTRPLVLLGVSCCKSSIPDLSEASRKGDMFRLELQKKKERFISADKDANGVLSRRRLQKIFPIEGLAEV